MTIKLNAIKCPNCNANIQVEEGRDKFFCSYCGAQIVVTNENEHIYRCVDEARIVESKNEKDIKLKELEIKEKTEKKNSRRKIIAYVLALFLFIFGLLIRETDFVAFLFMLGCVVFIVVFFAALFFEIRTSEVKPNFSGVLLITFSNSDKVYEIPTTYE